MLELFIDSWVNARNLLPLGLVRFGYYFYYEVGRRDNQGGCEMWQQCYRSPLAIVEVLNN